MIYVVGIKRSISYSIWLNCKPHLYGAETRDGCNTVIDIVSTFKEDLKMFATHCSGTASLARRCEGMHGDASVYDALVRMIQPFKMYIPLLDGHGNFGSIQGDSQASMRYCITGDSLVKTSLGVKPIKEIYDTFDKGRNLSEIVLENSELQVKSLNGEYNNATRIFSCGEHDIIKVTLNNGIVLEGTPNHPVLTIEEDSTQRWVNLEDVKPWTVFVLDNDDEKSCGVCEWSYLREKKNVYTFRVDSKCHSYISNGVISHNTEMMCGKHTHTLYFNDRMEGVTWKNNYDDSIKEPNFLPAIFPIILVNGSQGMAVGMATNIPSHNIIEVLNTYIAYIEKKLTNKNIRKYLPGPDTCIGSTIIDTGGIDRAYLTGRGSYSVTASYEIEAGSYGRETVVFTSVLPDKTTAGVVEKIANLVKTAKLDGISDIADESSMVGIRIVITTKKGVKAKDLLLTLFSMNICHDRYGMSMIAIHNGSPVVYNIMDMMRDFHIHNIDMHTKIFNAKIEKHLMRLKLLDALDIVVKKYDDAIKTISSSKSKSEAKDKVMKKFKLDEDQADYILDSKLYQFVSKGKAIHEEMTGIKGDIKNIKGYLSDIDSYLIDELKKLKVVFKSYKRRSTIRVIGKSK